MKNYETIKRLTVPAVMNPLLRMLVAPFRLQSQFPEVMQHPMDCGHYLQTDRRCTPQTKQNNSDIEGPGNSQYFLLVPEKKNKSNWVSLELHKVLHYSREKKMQLPKGSQMQEIVVLKSSGFVGHGFVQHAGPELNSTN